MVKNEITKIIVGIVACGGLIYLKERKDISTAHIAGIDCGHWTRLKVSCPFAGDEIESV